MVGCGGFDFVTNTGGQNVGRFKRLGYSGQLIVTVVIGSLVLISALLILTQKILDDERAQIFANVQDINNKMVLSDEVRIRSLLASLDKVMLVLRRDIAENPKLTRQALLRRLDELQVEKELSPRMSFVDASGEVVLSSARSIRGTDLKINVADREYFQDQKAALLDVLHVGSPIQSRATGKWVIPLTRRITRQDGSFGGILDLTVDPDLFTEPFEKTSVGPDATRALMRLDGYTLLRLNGGHLVYGGDTRKSQLYKEIKKSAAGCYTAIAASDGVRRSVCYRVIAPYSIVIVAGTSLSSMENIVNSKVRGYIGAAVLLAVLIIVLAGLLIIGILRQQRLLASKKSFKQLIELVPQSIFRMNAQGNILWVNRRTIDYAGPSADERAKGFDWVIAAVHPEDRDRLKAFVTMAIVNGQCDSACEYRKRRSDGAYLWFSSQITQVVDDEAGETSYLFTGTDIHDRKMAEERARVTQKLESIGQLTGGMAHDFNNLLAIIVGNLDMVKPNVKDEADSKRLSVASSAAQRGVGLVKSLLALASKQPLLPVNVDLWALIDRISPLLRHALGQRVNFELKPAASPVHVHVDEAGLESVLLNLIVNARDAMPQGGDLTLSLDVLDGMARILVKDTGTGMPETVLKRATEPFFTTKERGDGTGLGLSMVAGFAKQSGGSIKIQSAEGQGTTISVCLPIAMAESVTATPVAPVAMSGTTAAPGGRRRILIVDDEPALAELVRDWVREEGHTAVLAQSADDALTLLAVRAFDVLLSDINMPGHMDGIGLAEKASALYPAMKVLLMSGYSRETATRRADLPWTMLVKPFRKEDLVAALKSAFGASAFGAMA